MGRNVVKVFIEPPYIFHESISSTYQNAIDDGRRAGAVFFGLKSDDKRLQVTNVSAVPHITGTDGTVISYKCSMRVTLLAEDDEASTESDRVKPSKVVHRVVRGRFAPSRTSGGVLGSSLEDDDDDSNELDDDADD